MYKKIILTLFLLSLCVVFGFAQAGTYTTNGYFYLPLYGAYGLTEFNEYNAYMQIADTQIEANKTGIGSEAIQDIAGAMWTGNTETFLTLTYQDVDGTIDAVVPVKDEDNMASDSATFLCTQQSIKAYADTLHALQYLKTEMNEFAELQAIVADKTLVNEEDIFTIDANWVNTAHPWADNEVANDITIDLATLATTFTCTDNENENLACTLVFVDGPTGAQGAETDGDCTYNPSTGMIKSSNVHFSKFDATVAPTVNNDTTEGYVVGSVWYDVTADAAYGCLDNTDGAAVWSQFIPTGGGGGWVDISGTPVDNDFAKFTDADTIEGRSYSETRNDLSIYTIFPQDYATGAGTSGDPWAGDCINDAYTACPAGGTIFMRAGYYSVTTLVTISKHINLIGEGIDNTFIVTGDNNGINIASTGSYTTLGSFTLNADAQTGHTSSVYGINLDNTAQVILENIEVKNSGYYGINAFEANYTLFQNIFSHANYRHGVHFGSNTVGRNKSNTCRNIYVWDNTVNGFDDRGDVGDPNEYTYNTYDNIRAWDNTAYGIYIGYQRGGILSNSFVYGNGTHGIDLQDVEDFNMHDCATNLNGTYGINIDISKYLYFTNVIAKNNNTTNTSTTTGMRIENSSNITLTSCHFYDDRTPKLQDYAFKTVGTVNYIECINCEFRGNLLGRIFNTVCATITGTDEHSLIEDHDYSGRWETAKAGEAVVFGELLYFNWTDKEWKKTDADAAATMPGLRIALETAADGANCLMLICGDIRDDSAFAFAGSIVYASCTPGDITSTAPSASGDQAQRVGVAAHADYFYFNPDMYMNVIP